LTHFISHVILLVPVKRTQQHENTVQSFVISFCSTTMTSVRAELSSMTILVDEDTRFFSSSMRSIASSYEGGGASVEPVGAFDALDASGALHTINASYEGGSVTWDSLRAI
jgi:hypothetical protein